MNKVALIALVRPITLNFKEPIVFLLKLYIALIYGLLYIWFESLPIVFEGIYHFELGQEGLALVGILLVGAIITMWVLLDDQPIRPTLTLTSLVVKATLLALPIQTSRTPIQREWWTQTRKAAVPGLRRRLLQ